jgi:hypothetical protein
LPWTKITGTPTTLAGYGITDAYTQAQVDTLLNAKQNTLTLTTTGTSGAATLVGATLNIPQYQSVITNPVTGTGAAGQVAYWSSASAITGESNLFWDATNDRLGIGTASPSVALDVNGTINGGFLTISRAETTAVFTDTRANIHTTTPSFKVQNTGDTSVTTLSHRLVDLDYAGDADIVTGTYIRFLTAGTERAGLGLTSDKFTITTGVAERLTIDASGNVGIGTATPATKLSVITAAGGNTSGLSVGSTNGLLNIWGGSTSGVVVDVTNGTLNGSTATDLIIRGGGSERMRITASGRVLIGTPPPTESTFQLDVNGTGRFSSSVSATSGIFSSVVNVNGASSIEALNVNGNIILQGTANRYIRLQSATNYFYNLSSVNDDFQILEAGSIPRLTIKYPNGNVGIGTASPENRLTVANGNIGSGINNLAFFGLQQAGNPSIGDGVRINLGTSAGITRAAAIEAVVSSGLNGHHLAFLTNVSANIPTERMRITAAGRVLIGTPPPTESTFQLDVNGTARVSGDLVASSNIYSGGSTSLVTSTGVLAQSEVIQIFNGGAASTNIDKIADLILANNMPFTDGTIGRIIGVNNNLTSADKRVGQIAFGLDGATNSGAIGFATMSAGTFGTRLTIASTGAATFSSSVTATSIIRSGGTSSQYLMADGSVSTLTNPVTGTGTAGQVAYWSSGSAITGESNLFWDATNDRLGIGTASPGAKLEVVVANSATNVSALEVTNAVNASFNVSLRTGVTQITAGGDGNMAFSNSTERMRITSTGNVGIGTDSPATRLDVGVLNVAGIIDIARFASIGNGGVGRGTGILIGAGGIGNSVQVARLVGYQETGFATANNAAFAIQVANSSATLTEYLKIFNTGNVVIQNGGTFTDAGFRLDVNGTGRFSGQLTASTTAGGTSAIFQNTGAQNSNGIELRGGTGGTAVNWKIEKDNTVGNAFQLTPSTTNGGTTYTTPVLTIASTGAATFSNLAGTGTRMVVADANGLLSTQAIGSGAITGSGTTNYLPKFTGASTIGNSQVFDNGTNVGIGTTSVSGTYEKLAVAGGISIKDNTNAKLEIGRFNTTGAQNSYIKLGANSNSLRFTNNTDIADIMELTNSGNLGLGVTPSAWSASWSAQQFGQAGSLFAFKSGSNYTVLSNNSYAIGGGYQSGDARYINDGLSTAYIQNNSGQHLWMTAPSGTAGNAISFTQAMTLGSNSGLSIGTPSAAPAQGLLVQGAATFSSSVTLSASNGNLDVGGEAFIRGNGSIYKTHDFTTGAANVAIYHQRNASGTIINKFDANGFNYITGGNVGIGTASPSYKLSIQGNAGIEQSEEYFYFNSSYVVGSNARARIRAVGAGGGSGYGGDFRVSTRATNNVWNEDAFVVDSSANVGIGTASPTTRLDIGNGTLTLPTLRGRTYTLSNVSSANPNFINGTGFNSIPVRVGDIIDLPFSQTRTVTAVTDTQLTVDSAWTTSFAGVNVEGRGAIVFQTNNLDRLTIAGTGNVGIGTTSPNIGNRAGAGTLTVRNNSTYAEIEISGSSSSQGGVLSFYGDTTKYAEMTGEFQSSNNGMMIFRTRSSGTVSERMRITASGRVLIGTPPPAESTFQLDVSGTGRFSSTVTATSGVFSSGTTDNILGGGALVMLNYSGYNSSANQSITLGLGLVAAVNNNAAYRYILGVGGDANGQNLTLSSNRRGIADLTILTVNGNNGAATFGSSVTATSIIRSGGTSSQFLKADGSVDSNTYVTGGPFLPLTGGTLTGALGGTSASFSSSVTAGGDVIAFSSSDRRLKDNITSIKNPLQKINKIGGYSFTWNSNQDTYSGNDYGVVAQEIEEIFPELVRNRDNGYKAVKYEKLIPLLIESIKELSKEVEILKQK